MTTESNLSIVKYSVILEKPEYRERMEEVVRGVLNDVLVAYDVSMEPVGDGLWWFAFNARVDVENMRPSMVALTELGAELASDAEEHGFPPNTAFTGSAVELLVNSDQSDDASSTETLELETYLISNTYDLNVRNRLLRDRIEFLESEYEQMEKAFDALYKNLEAQKVMNFQYAQFHKIPQFLHAVVQAIGKEKLTRVFEDMFDESITFPPTIQ